MGGLWSPGALGSTVLGTAASRPWDHLGTAQARSVPAGPPCPRTSRIAALQPIRARIDLISRKLRQNGQVSPKYHQKASRSPYIQNGLQNSPLEKLRFLVFPAFSHKELMVPFMREVMENCQNDEVSTDVHTGLSREVSVRYPQMSTQQAALVDIFLI